MVAIISSFLIVYKLYTINSYLADLNLKTLTVKDKTGSLTTCLEVQMKNINNGIQENHYKDAAYPHPPLPSPKITTTAVSVFILHNTPTSATPARSASKPEVGAGCRTATLPVPMKNSCTPAFLYKRKD